MVDQRETSPLYYDISCPKCAHSARVQIPTQVGWKVWPPSPEADHLREEVGRLRMELTRLDEGYGEALARSERYQTEALELRAAVEALATKWREPKRFKGAGPVGPACADELEDALKGAP